MRYDVSFYLMYEELCYCLVKYKEEVSHKA
jgi:hypothetical protein